MKNNTDHKDSKKFPVREDGENSSILHDKKPPEKNEYPRQTIKDKQLDNQPEFIEEQPNKKANNNNQ